jgi:hypothetical protein
MPLTLEQKVAKVTEFHELALDHADVLTEQLAELHAENQDLRLVNARLSAALISLIERGACDERPPDRAAGRGALLAGRLLADRRRAVDRAVRNTADAAWMVTRSGTTAQGIVRC